MIKGFRRVTSIFLVLLLSFSLCSCANDNTYVKINIDKGDKFEVRSISKAVITMDDLKYSDFYQELGGSLECISKDDTNIKSEFKITNNKAKSTHKKKGELLRVDDTNLDNLSLYNAVNKVDGIIETDKDWKYVAFDMKDDSIAEQVKGYVNVEAFAKSIIDYINHYDKKTLVEGQSYDLGSEMTKEYTDVLKQIGVDSYNVKLKYEVSDITSKYAVLKIKHKQKVENLTYNIDGEITIDLKTGIAAKTKINITLDNVGIKDEDSKTGTAKLTSESYIIKK